MPASGRPSPAPGPEPTDPSMDPRRATVLLMVLAGAALLVNYVETMLVPALPTLVAFFGGVPYTTIAWVVSAYLLVGVSTTPLFAKLGDIYGKKRMLVIVLTVYAIAVAVAGFTPQIASLLGLHGSNSVYLLIGLRGVQGVGLAMFPLAFAMVGEELPAAKVGQAQGLIAAMFAIGAALGLFGGAWLIQSYGWQFAYHSVIPFAFGVLLLAFAELPESHHRLDAQLDVPGAALLGASLASFLVALSQGPSWGWERWASVHFGVLPFGVPELLLLSLGWAVLFYFRERSAPAPIIRLERFKERNLALSYLGALIVGTCLFLGFVGITIIVETPVVGLGRTVFEFGELSLPTTLSMLVAAPFVGKALSRFGPRPVMMLGAGLSSAGFLLLLEFDRTFTELLLAPIPTFVGLVMMLISVTNVVVLSSRRGETGIQTGMAEMFQDLGASIGPVLVATVLTSFMGTFYVPEAGPTGTVLVAVELPTLGAFHWLFGLGALLAASCGVLAGFLNNYRFAPSDLPASEGNSAAATAPRGSPTSE